MKILYISLAYKINSNGLYSDLIETLALHGHTIDVVVQDPDVNQQYSISLKNKIRVIRVKSQKFFNVSNIKKALAMITLPYKIIKGIKKSLPNEKYDLILSEAPPVTMWKAVKYAKNKYKCPAFLQQKDIFPQGAVDLGFFSKHSLPYLYFRHEENNMIKTFDYIGCMSQGNINYLISHNKNTNPKKFIYFPNSKIIENIPAKNDRVSICEKLGIDKNSCIFLFGGNMGKPQYVSFLCETMKRFNHDTSIYFICIGNGTDAHIIKSFIEKNNISNAQYLKNLPREDYESIANNCDVGLVILNPNFTIPNYPSKTLGYMESCLPILVASDYNTDYRDLIETQAKCGLWSPSNNIDSFCKNIKILANDKTLRENLGMNGRKYLEENFTTEKSVQIIENLFTSSK